MTPDAAMDVIEPVVATWAAAQNITVAYPDVSFNPSGLASWAKLDFIWGTGTIETKDRRGSVTGVMQLAIFGLKDNGDGPLDAIAQTARAVFNQLRFASPNQDVMFGAVSGPVRQFEESWRSLVVSAPFQVWETA